MDESGENHSETISNESVVTPVVSRTLLNTLRSKLRNTTQLFRTKLEQVKSYAKAHWRKEHYIFAGLVLVLVVFTVVRLVFEFARDPLWLTYSGSYRLVPDSISQSAILPISIPEEAGSVTSEQVQFVPELQGDFIESDQENILLFKPHELPQIGSYYNVALTYNEVTIGADFKVAEDPSVVSILPTSDTEVHEDTKISVVFNRPMVPLSTRDELDKETVPVKLEPDVDGVWKWKSTRLLQFIPKEDLQRATKYTVTVNEGFRSLDGVPVKGFTHSFTTRTLKHHPVAPMVRFNQPLEIRFNQDVDLERTAEKVVLTQNGEKKKIRIEYAKQQEEKKRGFLGLVFFGSDAKYDKTKILIRPYEDTHGREGLWDFESTYNIEIKTMYPLEGDIPLNEVFTWSYTIPAVVSSVQAKSDRSNHVGPDFFDPQGALAVYFQEPIDISKTNVTLHRLDEVRYGTACKFDADGAVIYKKDSQDCEEVEDKNQLLLRVNPDTYQPSQSSTLVFEKITSEDGYILNAKPLEYSVTSFPTLEVHRTVPSDGSSDASLTDLTICSNTPLKRPESIRNTLTTEGYVVFPNDLWRNSERITSDYWKPICSTGEFQTTIRYGLHPQTKYLLKLSLEDEFGARAQRDLHFTTGSASSKYTRFYNLQKYYNVTVPGKSRLTYGVENLPYVQVHICKVDANDFLRILDNDTDNDAKPSASMCETTKEVTVDLPDTYWVNNYFHFDVADHFEDARGHYIITFTHPNYRNERGVQLFDRTLLSVSNFTVGEKRLDWYTNEYTPPTRGAKVTGNNLYWVLHAKSLEPVYGATVETFAGKNVVTTEKQTTNIEGIAQLSAHENTRGAVVTLGGDTAVVSAAMDTLAYNWNIGTQSATYLYTDRPIYRPGDTVQIKGIDRVGYDNKWNTANTYNATVKIVDSRNDTISTQTVPVSLYGTFNLSIELPKDAPLGRYSISTFEGYGWFDVEEYVGAPFKVEVDTEASEYIAGETAKLGVDARYYFDMPVAGGELEYTVLAQDYHFDRYTDEYFSFGSGWYRCYWCGYGDEFITRATVTLDEDGKAFIEVPLTFDTYFEKPEETGSKLFTVIARVTDANGKQVTGQNTVVVHRGAYYLGIKTDKYVAIQDEPLGVRMKSVDTQGVPRAVTDLSLHVTRVEWVSYRRQEVDGGYYWHSEEKKTLMETRTVHTSNTGDATENVTFTQPGVYELTLTGKDTDGNTITSLTELYVSGKGTTDVRPTNNEALAVKTDKPNYSTGEEATVVFESPYADARALITVERGAIYEYWIQRVTSSIGTQKFPIQKTYAPSVYASVLLLGPGPEVKYGSTEIRTDSSDYELTIEAVPSKQSYFPGEEVVLTVKTTDQTGAPVSADVSLAIVDMSVLALMGNPKKDPVSFFYGSLPLGISTSHSAKNMLIEQEIPTGTKGGGGDSEDLETRKRGIFKDTAYWEASVVTNAEGEATVSFVLPDNLTTWQIESLGVTQDTKLGVSYLEFTTKKNLMATPQRPRFVVPGDTMWLGIQVANNTDKDITTLAHIESATLTIIDTKAKSVRVDANSQKTVYFATHAPQDITKGSHLVTFFTESDDLKDVVEQRIPILEDITYEVTATAGMTKNGSISESVYIPDYVLENQGELIVRAQPTLVTSLLSAISVMSRYPYECTEQIASRLASLATIRRMNDLYDKEVVAKVTSQVFDDPAYSVDDSIETDLAELLGRQTGDGGFSFYSGSPASMYLTVEVVTALTTLRETGFTVPDEVFNRATNYISSEFARSQQYNSEDLVARIAYAYSSPYVPIENKQEIAPRVIALANNKLMLEQLSSTALGYLAIATYEGPYPDAIAETYYSALQNRLTLDARGAFVTSGAHASYSWFESNEKNTALLLRAITQRGGEHVALDTMLRWLMVSKQADGGWGSTNATYTVLDTVLRLAEQREENRASYLLELFQGSTSVATHRVTPQTLFDSLTYTFPISEFVREKIHHITIKKSEETKPETVYYDMQLRYALPPDLVPPRDEGFTIERVLTKHGTTEVIEEANVGDIITGKLEITVPRTSRAVSVESYIPAGFELVNFKFATEESRDLNFDDNGEVYEEVAEVPWYDPEPGLRMWPTTYEEMHDDRVFTFTEEVQPGTYVYEYTLRALIPGTYRHMPAVVQEMYTPEVYGRTNGSSFTIAEP